MFTLLIRTDRKLSRNSSRWCIYVHYERVTSSSVIILRPNIGHKTTPKYTTRQHIRHYKFSDVRRISTEPARSTCSAGGLRTRALSTGTSLVGGRPPRHAI